MSMSNPKERQSPSIAIVYDRLNKFGGAERLLQVLHEAFPTAPVFTSVYDPHGASWAKGWDVRTSFLQKIPFLRSRHEIVAPLMPLAFESFDFSEFDVVISVTSEAAKGVVTKPGTMHFCWLLTPTRYLWSGAERYERDYFVDGLAIFRAIYRSILSGLRNWDLMASSRPDKIVPISQVVSERVRKYYHRAVEDVVYPPVLTNFFVPADEIARKQEPFSKRSFFLVVSRLVPYKKIDVAIQACIQAGKELMIIGVGSDEARLRRIAGNSPLIHFLGYLTDREILGYYQACRGLLFPGEDDFGLTVLEAMSCGTPSAVCEQSGNAELVEHGKHGILVERQTVDDWVKAIHLLETLTWKPKVLRQKAETINADACMRRWKELVLWNIHTQ